MKPTLLVLAAGMGSRYGGLKQLDPVGPSGEIIIDYSVFDAIRAGFGKIVFLIRRDIENAFKNFVEGRYGDDIEIGYAYQGVDDLPEGFSAPSDRAKPWGTGHAVLMAREEIPGPFAVINADDFYGRSGFESLAGHLTSPAIDSGEAALVGFELLKTLSENGSVSRGVCSVDDSGYLVDVAECTKIERNADGAVVNSAEGERYSVFNGDELVSMNMWGFPPSVFEELERRFVSFLESNAGDPKAEFYIPFAVDGMIKDGVAKVKVLPSSDQWFGVTYREDKPIVEAGIRALVDAGEYPAPLFG